MKKKFSIAAVLLAVTMAITGCSDSILNSKVESGTESKENIWTAADTDIVAFPTADGLTEEQKKLFSYFVPIRGVSEQLVEILDNDRRCKNRLSICRGW